MICVSIAPKNYREFEKTFLSACAKFDFLELRAENLVNIEHISLLAPPRPKIIYTLRDKSIPESKRINLLNSAIEMKIEFIDIDIDTITENLLEFINIARKKGVKIILSYHNFTHTPEDLQSIYNKLFSYNPDYVKIACYANDITDNIKIFKLLKENANSKIKLIAFCMGEKGEISRILAPKFGSAVTYASFNNRLKTADGQLNYAILTKVFNYKKIESDTKIFGLAGNPVSQSKGIIVHNNEFKLKRKKAVYLNFLIDDFEKFIEAYKPLFTGLSVTIPFKEIAVRFLDEISDEVKIIGAVNTIIKKGDKLIGYNTDAIALLKLLPKNISGKTVAVLGTGGAARSAIYAISQLNAKAIVFGRDPLKAKKLAEHFKCEYDKFINLKKYSFDVLINATSIGMVPDYTESPVEKNILKPDMLVVEFVYNPEVTRLLMYAKSTGCKIISGSMIFKTQAKLQKKLFMQSLENE